MQNQAAAAHYAAPLATGFIVYLVGTRTPSGIGSTEAGAIAQAIEFYEAHAEQPAPPMLPLAATEALISVFHPQSTWAHLSDGTACTPAEHQAERAHLEYLAYLAIAADSGRTGHEAYMAKFRAEKANRPADYIQQCIRRSERFTAAIAHAAQKMLSLESVQA